MKRIILLVTVMSFLASALTAQIKIPFDVPEPTWELLITCKPGHETRVFEKANASSYILVSQCGEDCNYQWAPSHWIPEGWNKVTVGDYDILPFISEGYGWVNFELNPEYNVWAQSRDFQKYTAYELTPKDIEKSPEMLAFSHGTDLYVICEGGGGPNYDSYWIGKFKDGYVVFPYICYVDMDPVAKHPGILNGVVGGFSDISKFTMRDVQYLLENCGQDEVAGTLVAFGGTLSDGSKGIQSIRTSMVSDKKPSAAVDDNQIYTAVETEPQFPGGMAGIFKHIALKMKYPALAQENNIQGKVVVSLVIEKDGSIGDVAVVQKVDSSLDKEAVRVVKTLPEFTSPAKINGRPVRYKMNLPVTFRLK